MADLRTKIAWLLWCANEGYLTEADRAGVSNIFTADPATLHPDDAFSLPKWLGMADALIRELKLREETWITTRSQPSTATSPNGRRTSERNQLVDHSNQRGVHSDIRRCHPHQPEEEKMKISELLSELERIMRQEGDMDVWATYGCGCCEYESQPTPSVYTKWRNAGLHLN